MSDLRALSPTSGSPVYSAPMGSAPSVRVTETVVTEQCAKPVACGAHHQGYDMGHGWGWLGALIMWLLIFIVFFWLVFFSLKPSWVLKSGTQEVDTAKVLLAAVIAAVILVIIIWLIKLAVSRAY